MRIFSKYKYQIKTVRRKTVLLLLFLPLLLTIFIFRILPIKWVRRFADFGGRMFYKFGKKSRNRALHNLKLIYGNEVTDIQLTEMAKASLTESVKSFFDYMAYSHVKDKKKYFRLVKVTGEEHLKAAYQRGKGVICLVPHMSSWEFAAITPPMLGYSTSAASKAMKMELLEWLMVKFRTRRGMKNITREGSYQALTEVLKRGECLIIMTDQDTRVKGIFVDFLGKTAYTPLGASRLLADTDAALVPMAMTRREDGDYLFTIYPELPAKKTGDQAQDLMTNTINQNKILGEMIRKNPTQWVWMHQRWKTTPESLDRYLKARALEKTKK